MNRLFIQCPQCQTTHFISFYRSAHYVCSRCGHHARLDPPHWIRLLCDRGSFRSLFADLRSQDPLEFPRYREKLAAAKKRASGWEAVVTGTAAIGGEATALALMDPGFIMASMGSVVGEKIARLLEFAAGRRLPVVMVISSGGARMQEGILSLMQMAKTAAAVRRLHANRQALINVLTDPTTGGVTASFAMLGDVSIAETGALIGFAGPRVIQQTIGQKLPPGFQTAEFLLEKGMLDLVVPRRNLRGTLATLLKIHRTRPYPGRRRGEP